MTLSQNKQRTSSGTAKAKSTVFLPELWARKVFCHAGGNVNIIKYSKCILSVASIKTFLNCTYAFAELNMCPSSDLLLASKQRLPHCKDPKVGGGKKRKAAHMSFYREAS